ncbi:unnamed protein product [Mytilus coruscus]|uniref:Uncharacterized protein n=1 Tax=Mytilus coruscus TaxID=42192 RepID=A0A6J8A4N8_MYTCO|nr:unnamed protein product [Mytilus coruscus]
MKITLLMNDTNICLNCTNVVDQQLQSGISDTQKSSHIQSDYESRPDIATKEHDIVPIFIDMNDDIKHDVIQKTPHIQDPKPVETEAQSCPAIMFNEHFRVTSFTLQNVAIDHCTVQKTPFTPNSITNNNMRTDLEMKELKQSELRQRETKLRKKDEELKIRKRIIEDTQTEKIWFQIYINKV